MSQDASADVNFVRGDATGLAIPAHEQVLRDAGAAFLTEAFRAFGVLSPDNEVTCITRFEPCAAGNSGQKLFLSVEYARAESGLHADLFVKFSRDFGDMFRDRRRYELEAEVRLATLSRNPAFPVDVPAAFFADFNHASGTGLLITQRIAFGRNGIEPILPKCMDHQLADPLAYYRATITALARLAAAHKSGALSPQLETLFPFNADAAAADLPIPWNEAQLREKIAGYAAFTQQCPRLLPAELRAPHFIDKLERDALRFLRHEPAIKRFLHAAPDLIALCHWNTNLDNAWFWRDASGALHCGLLDWGMVRQMNVAYGIWGGLSAADWPLFENHLDDLLALFIHEQSAHGGPQLDADKLKLHFDLSVAMLGLALMMDVGALVLSRLPDVPQATNPLDPIMHKNEVARCFLHVFTNFLQLWRTRDFGASLDRMLSQIEKT